MSETERMIHVEVLLFARARELAGAGSIGIDLREGSTVGDAARQVGEARPALGDLLRSCRFALNDEFVGAAQPLPRDATLAILPPVSGG